MNLQLMLVMTLSNTLTQVFPNTERLVHAYMQTRWFRFVFVFNTFRTSVTCWRCCVDCFDITEKSSRRDIGGYLVTITASGTSRVILSPSRRVSHCVARYIDLDSAVSSADCWEEAEGVVGVIGSTTCNLIAVTSLQLKLRRPRKLRSLRSLQLRLLPHVETFSLLVKVIPWEVLELNLQHHYQNLQQLKLQ